jgi:hypothetical protein
MKIYKDSELTEEIKGNILDLGTGLAGDVIDYKFYLLNDLGADLQQLNFAIKPNDTSTAAKQTSLEVEIIEAPKEIKSKEVKSLKLQWSPSVDVKSGLKAQLEIKGFELWS